MRQGTITQWHDDKGWGLIAPDTSGEALFFHIKAFEPRTRRPQAGLAVIYIAGVDAKGRVRATSVKAPAWMGSATNESRQPRGGRGAPTFPWLAGLIALATPLAVWQLSGSLALGAAYAVMSVISLLAYNLDKAKAAGAGRRTPESTLHLLDLACGWPGGLLAQHLFRHKNRKMSFQAAFWLTVALNIAAVAYFHPALPAFH